MRYTMWLIGLFLLSVVCPAAAETPHSPSSALVTKGRTSSPDEHEISAVGDLGTNRDASRTRLAQVNVEEGTIELTEPSGNTSNIFEHLQIDLIELEKMGQEVIERLVGEPLRLTLDECVQMALKANQDILISGYEPLLADSDLQSALGEFDPTLSAGINHSDSTTPLSPTFSLFTQGFITSNEQEFTTYSTGISGKLHWGTQYDLTFGGDRELSTFSGNVSSFRQDITLTLTQPLLRGFGPDSNRVRVRTARKALGISAAQLELTVLISVGDVIKAYWDLVGTIEQLGVRQESFANAMRLVEINEQRFNIGTAAAIEVLAAKAGAAARLGDLITARTAILDTEDLLKDLIGLYDDDLLSSKSIVPIERPSPIEVDWDRDRSMQIALLNRPEIRSAEIQLENARLERKSARDGLLPQLDLNGAYGQNARNTMFSNTFQGIVDNDGSTWTVGLTGSIPIGNRSARGTYRRAKVFERQQEQRLRQAKRQVMLGVSIALHSLVSNEILIESNKQTRILQEVNVAAEEKRLQLGVTTSHAVLEIQEDLTTAQMQEIQSMIDFEKSFIDLQVSEGMLLENQGIIYEPTGDDDPLGFFHSINPVRSFR